MSTNSGRKLALFISVMLLAVAALTLVPDTWLTGGSPACHSCHEAQAPADHMLFRQNYLGYNSLCSFAPFSTLILATAGLIIFLTTFRFRFERWGKEYRVIASSASFGMAILTLVPYTGQYTNLIGGHTLCPAVPISTGLLAGAGLVSLAGFMVCPFLVAWRCRCPSLEATLDVWQSPHRSINRLIRLLVTGKLDKEAIRRTYRCTLCNKCGLAWFNRQARKIAVGKGIVPSHLSNIRSAVQATGNPYGVIADGGTMIGTKCDTQKCDTLLFMGCTARFRTPEILEAARTLLDQRGIQYHSLPDETCCGYTLYNLGDLKAAYEAVDKNIARFRQEGIRRIITVCPGCYESFRTLYRGRDGFNPEILLAVDLLKDKKVTVENVILHEPCHAKGRGEVVRGILMGAGDESTGGCCGAGGGLISWDRMLSTSRAMKLQENSGKTVITYCPLCYLNFKRANPDRVQDLYMLMAAHAVHAADEAQTAKEE
ncbi:(Fe-S)-binding protein [Methanocella arvoryzae]|uniref:Predicted Fe-S cluster-binding oxidoreductase n=1 Tax=Methanocella arvoryzae (strain DSM 22066 / NBRC 105507 / MRE50) TaxID=351160 RepID=Q0W8I8_METAR|nr:(Fe-S)-binding protein [Methanocella arvoryzae]CAJ35305.1 predicted Fe-S cluster-binding oxidoreductase [Methanocella arvoryzae MRE50]